MKQKIDYYYHKSEDVSIYTNSESKEKQRPVSFDFAIFSGFSVMAIITIFGILSVGKTDDISYRAKGNIVGYNQNIPKIDMQKSQLDSIEAPINSILNQDKAILELYRQEITELNITKEKVSSEFKVLSKSAVDMSIFYQNAINSFAQKEANNHSSEDFNDAKKALEIIRTSHEEVMNKFINKQNELSAINVKIENFITKKQKEISVDVAKEALIADKAKEINEKIQYSAISEATTQKIFNEIKNNEESLKNDLKEFETQNQLILNENNKLKKEQQKIIENIKKQKEETIQLNIAISALHKIKENSENKNTSIENKETVASGKIKGSFLPPNDMKEEYWSNIKN